MQPLQLEGPLEGMSRAAEGGQNCFIAYGGNVLQHIVIVHFQSEEAFPFYSSQMH